MTSPDDSPRTPSESVDQMARRYVPPSPRGPDAAPVVTTANNAPNVGDGGAGYFYGPPQAPTQPGYAIYPPYTPPPPVEVMWTSAPHPYPPSHRTAIVVVSLVCAAVVIAAAAIFGVAHFRGSNHAADAAQLAPMNVQLSDLPAGWVVQPDSSDSDDSGDSGDSDGQSVPQCVGAKDTDPDIVATANSSSFALNEATINSSATSYRSAADIHTDTAILANPSLPDCFKQEIESSYPAGLKAGETLADVAVTVTPRTPDEPANVASTLNVAVTVADGGQTATAYTSSVLITGKQIESQVTFQTVGQPISADLMDSIVTKVANRVS